MRSNLNHLRNAQAATNPFHTLYLQKAFSELQRTYVIELYEQWAGEDQQQSSKRQLHGQILKWAEKFLLHTSGEN